MRATSTAIATTASSAAHLLHQTANRRRFLALPGPHPDTSKRRSTQDAKIHLGTNDLCAPHTLRRDLVEEEHHRRDRRQNDRGHHRHPDAEVLTEATEIGAGPRVHATQAPDDEDPGHECCASSSALCWARRAIMPSPCACPRARRGSRR